MDANVEANPNISKTYDTITIANANTNIRTISSLGDWALWEIMAVKA